MAEPDFDIVIAGAGLAGASSALFLSRAGWKVLVLEASGPASGASGIAAGLVNPLMARKAKRLKHFSEARQSLQELVEISGAAHLFDEAPVLRPAMDEPQAVGYRASAVQNADLASFVEAPAAAERWPQIRTPYGALLVGRGGAIRVPELVRLALARAGRYGAALRQPAYLRSWSEDSHLVWTTFEEDDTAITVSSFCLLLCVGAGCRGLAEMENMNLHPLKGQVATLSVSSDLNDLPHISGMNGYVVWHGGEAVVGTTYEHDFLHDGADDGIGDRLREQASETVPGLSSAPVISAAGGVRITVPGTRLPCVGPVPAHERTWVHTGLGAKGLLMAPFVATRLPVWLQHPDRIPEGFLPRLKSAEALA